MPGFFLLILNGCVFSFLFPSSLFAAKLRLIPSKYMISNWNHIYSTLEGYLGHPASTVRQMSSTVFKHLAFRASKGMTGLATSGGSNNSNSNKREDKESYLMLVAILKRLVFRWKLQKDLHRNVNIPAGGSVADGQKEETGEEELSWQCLEGRLLVYELLVGYLLANHRHFLAIDMALGRSGMSPSSSRRASAGVVANSDGSSNNHMSSPSVESKQNPTLPESSDNNNNVNRQRSNSTPDSTPNLGPTSSSSLQTPARSTSGKRTETPNDVMSPDPTASPALAVFALSGTPMEQRIGRSDSGSSSRRSSTSSQAGNGGGSSGGGANSASKSSELHSILTTLEQADDVTLDESSIFWNMNNNTTTTTTASSSSENTTVRSLFCNVLQMMLLQTKECLASKRFELRRMADQVLKPLSELVFYYDPMVMRGLWDHVAEWLSAKDTLSCRFGAETMLCCIKHMLSLSSSSNTSFSNQPTSSDWTNVFRSSSLDSSNSSNTSLSATRATPTPPPPPPAENNYENNYWTQRHVQQKECLITSLTLILPALHNLAKKAVTERLAAAIFELMVVVHSLFEVQPDTTSVETMGNELKSLTLPERDTRGDQRARSTSSLTILSLMYPQTNICEHLNIVIDRVINIHELANNITPTVVKPVAKAVSAAVLRKRRRRAITLDPALATSLIPHLPTLLSNSNTTTKQQLQLLPVVFRWILSCDAVDARVSLLDSVLVVLQKPTVFDALRSSCTEEEEEETGGEKNEYTAMLMASVDPICQLIERSLEAPVLGTVLDVVLGLTSVLPSEDVPTFLARVLPSAAKRLKQAAPQVCSWIVDQLRCMLWI